MIEWEKALGIYQAAVAQEFAQAVIERLGQLPETIKPVEMSACDSPIKVELKPRTRPAKSLVGCDVFIDWV